MYQYSYWGKFFNQRALSNRVAQNTNMSIFLSSLAIFPFLLMQGFQKCQKKLKKLTFCPSLRAFFVYTIAVYFRIRQIFSYHSKHQPNVIQSPSSPPSIVWHMSTVDFSLLDHQIWSTRCQIIAFFHT